MNTVEIWDFALENKIASAKPFDRLFVWITNPDFQKIKQNFMRQYDFFAIGASYRSDSFFRHVHAVEVEGAVMLHKDTGNLTKFLPLGIIHFFVDLLPYLIFVIVKRTSFSKLEALPKTRS